MDTDDMEESLTARQINFCNKYGLDFGQISAFTPLLHDLLDNICHDDINAQLILRDTTAKVILKLTDWYSINQLAVSSSVTPKQKSLLELFLYLNLVEGIYSETVNLLIILLINGGIDYSRLRRTQFSERYHELRKIPLFTRIHFIGNHGFRAVTNAIDKNLRNCIAHLDYFVEDDGTVTNKRTDKPIVTNLAEKNEKLGAFCSAIMMVIMDRFRPVKEGMSVPKLDLS